jgi:hypothetical protein
MLVGRNQNPSTRLRGVAVFSVPSAGLLYGTHKLSFNIQQPLALLS